MTPHPASSDIPPDPDPLNLEFQLDRFTHGDMTPAEVAAFKAAHPDLVASEEALRAHLRGEFVPPPPFPLPPSFPPAPPQLLSLLTRWRVAGLIVVGAAVLSGLVWYTSSESAPPPATPLAIYQAHALSEFCPEVEESDTERLTVVLSSKLGLSVKMGKLPAGVELRGISTAPGGSPLRLQLLARQDNKPVVLLIDLAPPSPAPAAAPPAETPAPGVHVFRARLGQLDLVEVSPFPDARLLTLVTPLPPLP